MTTGAIISGCGRFRFRLWRVLDDANPKHVLFIMLNPSTADESEDDPTIRRCLGYAKAWGMGRVDVVNLFPFRATKPADLWRADDREGGHGPVKNIDHVIGAAEKADLVVAAWGAHVRSCDGGVVARTHLAITHTVGKDLHALKLTKHGHPSHPLMLRKDLIPFVWKSGTKEGAPHVG